MKNLWSLLLVVAIATLLFSGVSIVLNQGLVTNDNVNEQTIRTIGVYDNQIQNLTEFQNLERPSTQLSDNNTNQVDAFFRQYAETKSSVNKFYTAINYIFSIPEILLVAIPFINLNDSALLIYKSIFWLIISFILIIALYKAFFTGVIDNER